MDGFITMDTVLKAFLPNQIVNFGIELVDQTDLSELEGWEEINQVFEQLNNAIMNVALTALPPLVAGIGWLIDHLSLIAPLVLGIGGAFAVFKAAALWTTVATKVTAAFSAVTAVLSAGMQVLRGQTLNATAAEALFNSTLLMSPVTWIVMGIMAFVGIIYTAASAIARFTGVANSGFGVICGAINVVIQFFKNLLLMVLNVFIGIGTALKAVGTNIKTAFGVAIARVQSLWYDLLKTVMDVIAKIAEHLNKLPFVEINVDGLYAAADEYERKAQAAREKVENASYVDIGDAFQEGYHTYDTFGEGWASNAFAAGAEWGDGVSSKISGALDGFFGGGLEDSLGDAGGGYGTSYGGYGKSDGDWGLSSEDLSAMREVTERQILNQVIHNDIKMEMVNHNNIKDREDAAGLILRLKDGMNEALVVSQERALNAGMWG